MGLFLSSMVESTTLPGASTVRASETVTISVMPPATGRKALVCTAMSGAASREQFAEALIAEAAANIAGGVQAGSNKVGSFIGIFPGTRITSHRQAAERSAQPCGAAATHGRKEDDVKLFAEVLSFAQPGIGDVGVRDFQFLHGNAEPAIILGVLPIVDEGDAGNGERMRLDAQRCARGVDFKSKIFGGFFELGAIRVANDEGASFELDAVGFERIFGGFHGNVGEAEP